MSNFDLNNPFGDMQEAKRPQVKFGKPGDWFRGTLVDNAREIENKLSAKHEMQLIAEFKMHGGSYHDIVNKIPVQEATEIKAGDFMSFFCKGIVKDQLKKAKIGQIVGLKFEEEKASSQPGYNATKIIKVYLGDMDPEYQGETGSDLNP